MTPKERRRLYRLHSFERAAWKGGAHYLCGIDEAGRGPLAGPVVACAVVIQDPIYLEFLNDSKVVLLSRREVLNDAIRERAVSFCVAYASHEEIDRFNILVATKIAMGRALSGLSVFPCRVFIDALTIPQCIFPQQPIIDGDAKCAVIAAASILAKVHRDRWMQEYDAMYPEYGFAHHKGYATAEHLAALQRLGPSPIHRRSFAPVIQPSFDFVYDGAQAL